MCFFLRVGDILVAQPNCRRKSALHAGQRARARLLKLATNMTTLETRGDFSRRPSSQARAREVVFFVFEQRRQQQQQDPLSGATQFPSIPVVHLHATLLALFDLGLAVIVCLFVCLLRSIWVTPSRGGVSNLFANSIMTHSEASKRGAREAPEGLS